MRPRNSSRRRIRQKPKFGNDTIARLPMRTSSSSTWRGWCVACNVWLSTTTSKAPIGISVEIAIGVPLDHRQPVPHAGIDAGLAQLDAARIDALVARQIGEQRAVAAADVEHARARLDHVGDQPQVAPQPPGGARVAAGSGATALEPARGGRRHAAFPERAAGRGARRSRQKAAQGREQLRLVQQERVVALVGLDLDKADIGGDRVQRVHDGAALRGREQPVAGERDDAEARLRAAERPPAATRHARPRGRNNPSRG